METRRSGDQQTIERRSVEEQLADALAQVKGLEREKAILEAMLVEARVTMQTIAQSMDRLADEIDRVRWAR